MDEFQSLAGRLLVAMPGIGDPRFEHAVILVCAHRPDHAMGLRLDRPAPGIDLKAVRHEVEQTVEHLQAALGEEAWTQGMNPDVPETKILDNPYQYTDYASSATHQA